MNAMNERDSVTLWYNISKGVRREPLVVPVALHSESSLWLGIGLSYGECVMFNHGGQLCLSASSSVGVKRFRVRAQERPSDKRKM